MRRKVSDLIAEFVAAKQMRHVFGIVGAANAHVFDSITQRGDTSIVCVHHEQAATMAMQTYFRTSGTITAAIVTAGGASANAITGVVSAWMDSIPGLVISGNENSRFTSPDNPLRIWGVQGFDSAGMVQRVTKYAERVLDPARILYVLEKAYYTARTGRPGPCWIDVPMNVQAAMVDEADLVAFDPIELAVRAEPVAPLEDLVAQVRARLAAAERPLLWLGHGIRLAGAQPRLEQLLAQVRVPALVSWAGIDMIDSDHPLVYGRAGVYGQRAANFILQNCDCLLAIGTRLAIPQVGYDLSEFARGASVLVVDVDQAELDKYRERYDLTIRADAGAFLDALLAQTAPAPLAAPAAWIARCDGYRQRYPWVGPEHADTDGYLNSYRFMARLSEHFKPDQVVVTDMGTALLSGHQVLRLRPGQRLMTSTGLGEMGYGLPAAVGASFARDRGEVLCLNCDGGMMMNLQELQTIAHHQLPIKIVVFVNDGYLMIKHTQSALFGRFAGTDAQTGVSCPDFHRVAEAFGFGAFQIRTWADVDAVLPALQAHDGPAICEVFMDPLQLFVPKLSLASRQDGTLISPPLEDLSPFLPRAELRENMVHGLHAKSEAIEA